MNKTLSTNSEDRKRGPYTHTQSKKSKTKLKLQQMKVVQTINK